MAELERRTGNATGNAFMLPAFHLGTMPASLYDVKETSMTVDWYEWNRTVDWYEWNRGVTP